MLTIRIAVLFRLLSCLAILLLISSCATTANYETILNSWVGAPVDTLVSSWGPPQSSFPLSNNGYVIEYVREGNVPIGGFTYYEPQTTYHSGSVSAFNNYGTSAYGSYSGTSTTYIKKQTPVYNVPLVCKTRFTVDQKGAISKWQWAGNNCKALPPKQSIDNIPADNQKYVDLSKVLNSSSYGQKAKYLLEKLIKERQNIIDMKGEKIKELKKTSASTEIIQQEINEYRARVTDAQDYVKTVEKKITDYILNYAEAAARVVANKNNFHIFFVPKENMDNISDMVITELNKNSDINVEKYFKSIK